VKKDHPHCGDDAKSGQGLDFTLDLSAAHDALSVSFAFSPG
jgi:hypothetical protein